MARYNDYDELDDQPKAKRVRRKRRRSLIGLVAVLTGLAAVAVTQRDRLTEYASRVGGVPYLGQLYQVGDYPVEVYQVAAAGATLALLALLLRAVTGRTRAGWPVLALLLCGAAAGTYRYENSPKDPGTPERWVKDHVVDKAADWIDQRRGAAPAATVETSAPAAGPDQTAGPSTKVAG